MKRSGFTLVELLVVIAIVGILVSLLLPAIQSVREAGRRTVCLNNIRQSTLGLLNFESSHGNLPAGITEVASQNVLGGATWMLRILPFIEQNPLWQRSQKDYLLHPIPFRSHEGMQTLVQSYICPSDYLNSELHFTHEGLLVANTDYLGVSGTNFRNNDGIFVSGIKTRFRDIRDGQSNTFLLGERPPSTDYWYGWWYASGQTGDSTGDATLGVAELRPSSEIDVYLKDCDNGPYRFGPSSGRQCDTLHFWSHHPGGGGFSLADGSVKFISYDTSDDVMQSLATRSGGDVNSAIE